MLTVAAAKTYVCGAVGQTTSVTTNLSYDYENRVTQITYPDTSTNTFTYNAPARVGKVDSGGPKTFKRDGGVSAGRPLHQMCFFQAKPILNLSAARRPRGSHSDRHLPTWNRGLSAVRSRKGGGPQSEEHR